ncbi:MAG: hypothetical protein AVDCRST_MAG59-2612, partial [uncultured Thermomicrobiales bacterium]
CPVQGHHGADHEPSGLGKGRQCPYAGSSRRTETHIATKVPPSGPSRWAPPTA